MILRKGAISAHKGERVLIPINMRDGSVIAVGKGNPEWNFSAPHGAGRIMSRAQARKKISLDSYKNSMQGIYTTSVKVQTLDRTFIDKLFALGDYYLRNETLGFSRHLYDVYKIKPAIEFDDDFTKLFMK